MSYIFRAYVYGEESGIFATLRDFLFRLGLRGTKRTTDLNELKAVLQKDIFPVLFIDHSPGTNEGFLLYERFRKEPGLELVPFFFLVGDGETAYNKYAESFGAKAVVHKPFNPNDLTLLMTPLSSTQQLQAHQKALAISKAMVQNQHQSVLKSLAQLEQTTYYSKGAGIALSRIFARMNRHTLTEKKLTDMLKRNPGDLRALCEVADLYLNSNKYNDAIRIFSKIERLDSRITVKVWEHLEILINIDDLNKAAELLKRMHKNPNLREPAIASMLRVLSFMGLEELSPGIAKPFPSISKLYPFPNTEEAS